MRHVNSIVGVVPKGEGFSPEKVDKYLYGQVDYAARSKKHPLSYADGWKMPRSVLVADATAPKKVFSLDPDTLEVLAGKPTVNLVKRPTMLSTAIGPFVDMYDWAKAKRAEEDIEVEAYQARQFQAKDTVPVVAALSLVGAIGLGAATSVNNVMELCQKEVQHHRMCMPGDIMEVILPTPDDAKQFAAKIIVEIKA
ncbi:MAG: hypothetical protein WBO35_06580 [Candidatus Saccharimonadales bacterium]|jgi:hypothetical protein